MFSIKTKFGRRFIYVRVNVPYHVAEISIKYGQHDCSLMLIFLIALRLISLNRTPVSRKKLWFPSQHSNYCNLQTMKQRARKNLVRFADLRPKRHCLLNALRYSQGPLKLYAFVILGRHRLFANWAADSASLCSSKFSSELKLKFIRCDWLLMFCQW